MAKKEILFPGCNSKLNRRAKEQGRKQKRKDKIEKSKNKEVMEFPASKTTPKDFYEIPNPNKKRIIKRGDQFPDNVKPINAERIELPWPLLVYYVIKAELLILKNIK